MSDTPDEAAIDAIYDTCHNTDRADFKAQIQQLIAQARTKEAISVLKGLEHDSRHHDTNLYELIVELIGDYKEQLKSQANQEGDKPL